MTWSWWITIWLRHLIKDAMKRVWGRKRESSLISWAWGLLDKCWYRFAFFNRRGLCVDFNTCHLLLKNILFPNGLVLIQVHHHLWWQWAAYKSVPFFKQWLRYKAIKPHLNFSDRHIKSITNWSQEKPVFPLSISLSEKLLTGSQRPNPRNWPRPATKYG